jgi:hypothetical protein
MHAGLNKKEIGDEEIKGIRKKKATIVAKIDRVKERLTFECSRVVK